MPDKLSATILASGFNACGELNIIEIVLFEDIRKICRDNTCRRYQTTWACPPAVGTLDECREKINSYEKAYLFSAVSQLKSSFDYQGMLNAHQSFKTLCDNLYGNIKEEHPKHLLLSNESCIRCKECTYPGSPCRFPEKLFPSLEGFGLNVSVLAKQAGLRYNNGEKTVTYFGMLLI